MATAERIIKPVFLIDEKVCVTRNGKSVCVGSTNDQISMSPFYGTVGEAVEDGENVNFVFWNGLTAFEIA